MVWAIITVLSCLVGMSAVGRSVMLMHVCRKTGNLGFECVAGSLEGFSWFAQTYLPHAPALEQRGFLGRSSAQTATMGCYTWTCSVMSACLQAAALPCMCVERRVP